MLWLYTFSIIRLFKSYNSHFVGNKAEEYGKKMHYIRFVDFLVGRFNTCWSFGAYSESESSICKSLVGRPSVNNMIRGAMQCSCIHVACPTLKHTKRKKKLTRFSLFLAINIFVCVKGQWKMITKTQLN